MTIKALSSFLKKQAPYARRKVPTAFFANRKIAIDGHLLAHCYMSTALSGEAKKLLHSKTFEINQSDLMERWLARWISTITMMMEAKMKPVVVFDGKDVPIEKTETRARRHAGKLSTRDEIKLLLAKITEEELEADMGSRERLVKLIARNIIVTEHHFSKLRSLLEAIGIPVLIAEGEGEALCATLVKEKKCYAILTQDSDAGPYLAPFVINSIENPTYDSMGKRYQSCEVIYYSQVITKLELTDTQFIDFCIMCGTDYNDNIPNFGPSKCYKLIKEFGCIEKIPLAKYNPEPLNYVRVREIFNEVYKIGKGELEAPVVDAGDLMKLLGGYGLMRNAGRLMAVLRGGDVEEVNKALACGGMSGGGGGGGFYGEVAQLELDPGDLL